MMEKVQKRRLRYEDRKVIEKMLNAGSSVEEVANKIGVHRTTIYSELRRCSSGNYSADQAQKTI